MNASRLPKTRQSAVTAALAVVIALIIVLVAQTFSKPVVGADTTTYRVTAFKVYDGDTFHALIDGVDERIRLIGVNAPEINDPTYAKEAEAARVFAASLIEGKTVWLVVDTGAERDRFGRILAYVWLTDPALATNIRAGIGRNTLNGRLVSEGYASPMTIKPNTTYAEVFESLASQAKTEGRGLWPSGVFGSLIRQAVLSKLFSARAR